MQYSAMTGQSLFYMGQTNLKHKVLAIAEAAKAGPRAVSAPESLPGAPRATRQLEAHGASADGLISSHRRGARAA